MSTNRPIPPPPLVSFPRITTLIASLFVSLSSGTNYVYSAYSPQLGGRLGISHTQLNIVALGGNVGVYVSGPLWGKIVDARGPRILLASAFVCLLTGYIGMRQFYDDGLPVGISHLSTLGFLALVACSFLTGCGGSAGLASAVNSTAKTFPDKARASTTGLVISGFGLSAFFFSTISHVFFAGNTSDFFLVLALGTSLPMIMGFFFVRPIPLPAQEGYDIVEDEDVEEDDFEAASPSLVHRNGSHAHLLDHDFIEPHHPHYVRHTDDTATRQDGDSYMHLPEEIQLNRSTQAEGPGESRRPRSMSRGAAMELDLLPNLHGKKLFRAGDFWLLFSILSILSGTGLMYINNVGSMSQALYAYENPHYDDAEAAAWQATQVSTISMTNFLGRIFIGLVSDFAKNKYDVPRSYCLIICSSLSFISQLVASNVDSIGHLWIASSLLGLAYGSAFSLLPTVCLEWFGMPHFSENWGYLSMSPMIGGNLFSLVFGRNLDAHEDIIPKRPASTSNLATRVLSAPQCLHGLDCYVDTIYLTVAATFLSILLSLWAGYRDRQKIASSHRKRMSLSGEVLWEDEERR